MSEDRFSKPNVSYATFRPEYPVELFDFLISKVPATQLCWDCATGNGQAARSLSKYFDSVVATDLSSAQIELATGPRNIEYRVAGAETAEFKTNSLDLIVVAQALHWFDLNKFYTRAKRFLKPDGIIAVWGYDFFTINKAIDAILDPYGRDFLKSYWSERNWLLINGYRDIDFPFEKVEVPEFQLSVNWSLMQVKGFLDSWSATQKFKNINSYDPYQEIQERLESTWANGGDVKNVKWKLHCLIGKNTSIQ